MTDSIRQDIIDAIETRFQAILIANGYETNLGSNVFIWKATPFQDSEFPGVDIRDTDDAVEQETVGEVYHRLPIECRCVVSGTASMADVRKITADITKAVGTDLEWSTLAQDTGHIQGGLGTIEIGDQIITGVVVRFDVIYSTARFNAYA